MELGDIAVGDKLVAEAFGRHGTYIVERITAALVVCDCGARFNRNTGHLVGEQTHGWGRTHARKYTENDALEERIKAAKESLRMLAVTAQNIEQVEALLTPAPQ